MSERFRVNLVNNEGIGFHCFDAGSGEPPKLLTFDMRFFLLEASRTTSDVHSYREIEPVEVILALKPATVSS